MTDRTALRAKDKPDLGAFDWADPFKLDQQLTDYASKTRSNHLIRTWETLKEQVPQLNVDPVDEDDGLKRTYRGQVIADAPPASANDHEEGDTHLPRKKKVIYRGQVVG